MFLFPRMIRIKLPVWLRRAPKDFEIERCLKALKQSEAGGLAWEDRGPFAEWNYRALTRSGKWWVLFHEGWDGTPRVGFSPVGGYVTQDTVVSRQFGDRLYESVQASLFGAERHERNKRMIDEVDADLN